ncbi:hypothetical protein KEJ26_00030 [Candidatus Bathyarchaeota archaeon]|nr:hypothetical protein [Candidatus Bathyarchaeota archaeon]
MSSESSCVGAEVNDKTIPKPQVIYFRKPNIKQLAVRGTVHISHRKRLTHMGAPLLISLFYLFIRFLEHVQELPVDDRFWPKESGDWRYNQLSLAFSKGGLFNTWTSYPPLVSFILWVLTQTVYINLVEIIPSLTTFVICIFVFYQFALELYGKKPAFIGCMFFVLVTCFFGEKWRWVDNTFILMNLVSLRLLLTEHNKSHKTLLSGLAAGISAMLRVFPSICVIIVALKILPLREKLRFVVSFAFVVGLVCFPFLWANPAIFFSSWIWQAARPPYSTVWAILQPDAGLFTTRGVETRAAEMITPLSLSQVNFNFLSTVCLVGLIASLAVLLFLVPCPQNKRGIVCFTTLALGITEFWYKGWTGFGFEPMVLLSIPNPAIFVLLVSLKQLKILKDWCRSEFEVLGYDTAWLLLQLVIWARTIILLIILGLVTYVMKKVSSGLQT